MCLFPFANNSPKSESYKKGVREFACGSCPECLNKKSRQWALRASMEAKNTVGAMITLTYDSYVYDEFGNIIGEKLPPETQELSKHEAQKFIKRLRARLAPLKIKYILTAERGKRTNRPHFHALIFGFDFPDRIKYKKSKRGNIIYRSRFLEKVWNNGICTVDCVNLSAKVARYCTKYCAKDSGAEDTFMLFSRGIGEAQLLEEFNGRSYVIDGMEYSIPKLIWNKKIIEKYPFLSGYDKYRSYSQIVDKCEKFANTLRSALSSNVDNFPLIDEENAYIVEKLVKRIKLYENPLTAERLARANSRKRSLFRAFRDRDRDYQKYLAYWKYRGELYERYRPDSFERISQLPNDKYFGYKQACFAVLASRIDHLRRFGTVDGAEIPPRSGCVARRSRYLDELNYAHGLPQGAYLPFTPLVIKGQMTGFNRLKPVERNIRSIYRPKKPDLVELRLSIASPFDYKYNYYQPNLLDF